MTNFEVVEICAGAGGQALGLERAGFEHALAVELDQHACNTLRANRSGWKVAEGDVADTEVWKPTDFAGEVDLLAGGVPCPPFTIAGKQQGAGDERDLFAWAVETCEVVRPRALLLENVKGLSGKRFSAYRQHVLDRLAELEYIADWRLLQANEYGVPQLRPRFVLVALNAEDARHFYWPEPNPTSETVGTALCDLMAANEWQHVGDWVAMANDIAETIVGGSKKHGGADLGPTRAKRAWRELGVDALGVADDAPLKDHPHPTVQPPKLTVEMVARLQGWRGDDWEFTGRKTAKYRQVGNAFPPPVAQAVGESIMRAFKRETEPRDLPELAQPTVHDGIFRALRDAKDYITGERLLKTVEEVNDAPALERRIAQISQDFELEIKEDSKGAVAYRLGRFKGFIGQEDHSRHEYLLKHRARVS